MGRGDIPVYTRKGNGYSRSLTKGEGVFHGSSGSYSMGGWVIRGVLVMGVWVGQVMGVLYH